MIRRPTKGDETDSYVGKFVLCDSPLEHGIVGELRYVAKASGGRLYVIRPERDGTIEGPDTPEGYIAAKRVKVICDTWEEAQRCRALNAEGLEAHKAIMAQWAEARKALHGKLNAMCDQSELPARGESDKP